MPRRVNVHVAVGLSVLGVFVTFGLSPAFAEEGLALQGGDIPGLYPIAVVQSVYLHDSEVHAAAQPIQGHPVTVAASETPARQLPVVVGMRKDVVRRLWGEPAEVRKIRVCLGTAEEWVYQGDPERYGANVRILSFDGDGVLTEIK